MDPHTANALDVAHELGARQLGPALDPVGVERQVVALDVADVALDLGLVVVGWIAREEHLAVVRGAHGPARRSRLPSSDRGELADRGRRGSRSDHVIHGRGGDLRLPGIRAVGVHAPVRDLVAGQEEAVAGGGVERRLDVVRGRGAVGEHVRVADRGRGEELGAPRAHVLLLEIVVELVAALVEGAVTAPEASERLAGGRREAV